VTDLGKTAAEWDRLLEAELAGAYIAPMREIYELRDKFRRERTQIWNIGDRASATPHITALTLAGVNYGTNTDKEGRLWVRWVADGGNWDINIYKAAGAGGGDLVAHVDALAASGTAALVADNSSGLSGSITIGATIAGDVTDRHQLLVVVDYPARLPYIFTGTAGIEDDKFSRQAAERAYAAIVDRLTACLEDLRAAATEWGIAGPNNPIGRASEFVEEEPTELSSDTAVVDTSSGNVRRLRTGLFPTMAQDMEDETTGGEQDVIRRVVAAAAGVFDAGNSGKGTVASHTPSEKTPAARWTFKCIRGSDTGDLGREEFAGTAVVTDGSLLPPITLSGLIVEKDWSGPNGIGSIRLRRTYAKTGDGSNLNLAAVTTSLFSGENNRNTDNGVLNWKIEANGSNWDVSFFRSASMIPSMLVAKATNVATGAALNATAQNGSGLAITWTVGSAPVAATTGTISCQPFLVENADGKPDQFEIETSETGTPGLYQKLMGRLFDAALNSDTSGSESISDLAVKVGTFHPFITVDN
jgi:hypothetical protein